MYDGNTVRKDEGITPIVDLSKIPEENRTKELCEFAMKQNPGNFRYVPDEFKTQEMCDFAVSKGLDIEYVPQHLRTKEMYEFMVFKYTYDFTRTPDEFKTQEMCNYAVSKRWVYLKYVPKEFITQEICNIAFNNDVKSFSYIPDEFKTQEMCNYAVSKSSVNLKHVPKEFITQEICNIAVNNNVESFAYIPDEFKTQEMCNYIVSISWVNLKHVPKEFITQEICNIAFNKSVLSFAYIPDEFKTQEMYDSVHFINLRSILKSTPEACITLEMYKMAVKENPDNYKFVPFKFRMETYDLYCAARSLSLVPEFSRTQELCEVAMSKRLSDFQYVPDEFKTQEMCEKAVLLPDNFKYVPDKFKTQKMCKKAVLKSPDNFEYVPDELKTEEMWIRMLEIDVYTYSKLIPKTMWNEAIFAVVKNELLKLARHKKSLPLDSELCNYIIDSFPKLLILSGKENINKTILEELKKILVDKGSIKSIAEKYGITTGVVNGILEQLKETDLELYDEIKKHLDNNQRKFWFANLDNVKNLIHIIKSLGDLNGKRLTLEQKLKFTYLYTKYVNVPLVSLYAFVCDKYRSEFASTLSDFFEKYLKFESMDVSERAFNNSWLSNYSSNRYWRVKEGVPTMTHIYSDKEMTKEAETHVIKELRMQQIPLKQIIVEQAFRHYANGTLNEYIRTLQSYDETMNKPKEK